ncbi:acid phosphatase [Tremella mesenterica]|uniref:Acid phosphatase n=1 Tax=Tremella mesenterica TaxID=5217 RepID=A0A4Q1BE77_TREME|nr:acid phosphatase [Tremella mesenterica]
MLSSVLIAILPILGTSANPVEKRWSHAPDVGATTSDVFPPTGTKVNSDLFPPESIVGYPQGTPTGLEAAAIQTAPVYAYNSDPSSEFPLKNVGTEDGIDESTFDMLRSWGNLSPWYSVPSSYYGLDSASPLAPESCSITQLHLLYRHGARYPTAGALPAQFAASLHNATVNGTWDAWGELDFLNTWTYKLGAELLSPFGRLQNFELGVSYRNSYGYLLNNFTEQGTLPVFRTESQDRMVKTAENFAAGFFGVPEYLDQVNIEIMVEAPGVNDTGAPYDTCTNANVAARGGIGGIVSNAFATTAWNSTVDRLNSQVSGLKFTGNDILAMLQLCAYETNSLGYSAFCKLFTQEDFQQFEYYFDLSFWYNNGFGSPTSAAQGLGLLQEFVARFEQTPLSSYDSTTNSTFDTSSTYFPLNQSIYADATHEVVVADVLAALNLTAVFGETPLDLNKRGEYTFKSSQVVPWATHLTVQVMECSEYQPTKQVRFMVNDAVIPLNYDGCPSDPNGLCAFDTVVSALKNRIDEIDFDYACFGN